MRHCVVLMFAMCAILAAPARAEIVEPGKDCLEAIARTGIHTIQAAIERYNVDFGCYPEYLIGGDYFNLAWVRADEGAQFSPVDPLIAQGYLSDYPVNPYAVAALKGGECFKNPIQTWQEDTGDPYCPVVGSEGVVEGNCRFGAVPCLMGNLMADPRYEGSAFGYQCWSVEELNEEYQGLLAGNFLYKSYAPPGEKRPTGYILALYGPPGWLGQDIIGPATAELAAYASSADGQGCPFSMMEGKLAFGNPDGKRDGTLVVVTGGSLEPVRN